MTSQRTLHPDLNPRGHRGARPHLRARMASRQAKRRLNDGFLLRCSVGASARRSVGRRSADATFRRPVGPPIVPSISRHVARPVRGPMSLACGRLCHRSVLPEASDASNYDIAQPATLSCYLGNLIRVAHIVCLTHRRPGHDAARKPFPQNCFACLLLVLSSEGISPAEFGVAAPSVAPDISPECV